MERAEALDGRGNECLDLLVLRHVAALDQRALGRKVGGDAFELGQVVAGEHDGGAFVGEAPGRGLADARAGAGDDDDLVDEALHGFLCESGVR